MGYDANLKSKLAVKQQRLTIFFTLIGLALACTIAVNFLRRPKGESPTTLRNKQQQSQQKIVGNNDKLLETINAAKKNAGDMGPLPYPAQANPKLIIIRAMSGCESERGTAIKIAAPQPNPPR